jgi:uncharacterized protein (DUF1330 family)
MAAYLIADVDVLDAEAFEEYKRDGRPATEQRYGGRYLGRGGGARTRLGAAPSGHHRISRHGGSDGLVRFARIQPA